MKVDYITTAIVYPNSRIHVGWAWECLGADWLVRSLKLLGRDAFFATGMDEHAVKVQRSAEKQGLSPQAYCDGMAEDIQKVLTQMGISYDRFIRTSDSDHREVVQHCVKMALEKGDIYPSKYEGHYCEGCEAFYTEKDLKEGGLCPVHGTAAQWISEQNYFFRLSAYEKPLLEHFEKHPDFLQPESRRAEVLNFIQNGLKDFSISRANASWGVPLPFDSKQIVYVWFDALINYLTAAGYAEKLKDPSSAAARDFDRRWPASLHIIGKDISRFHCVYWPAMLMSLQLPLPERVFAHGYITIKGEKLSKSLGNIVSPDEVMAWSGPDAFRYYLLAENPFSNDGNFAEEALIAKFNADLAHDWGNLINRSISMTLRYFPGETLTGPQKRTHSQEIQGEFEKLVPELEQAAREVQPSRYIASCMARSRLLNLYIDRTKPWALSKAGTPESQLELREVLFTLLEGVRWVSTALSSVIPFAVPRLFDQLGVQDPASPLASGSLRRLKWGEVSFRPSSPQPLYPKIEVSRTGGEAVR